MAQSGGKSSAGGGKGQNKPPNKAQSKTQAKPQGKSARQSVAAARKSSPGNNRTQLIIGGIAIVVIAAVIIFGLILNRQQTATQADGYGSSTQSVATASDGVVTVTKPGSTPKATIDVYEDPLCPICGELERQFGQQINQEVDNGNLTVTYHTLNFLNPRSHSGDYSSRAAGALLCVAENSGSQPGVYLNYHSALFSADNQPAENGSSDLSNQQLADLAGTVGASADAQTCVAQGQQVATAEAAATAASNQLQQTTGRVGTPTVIHNGAPVQLNADWLTNLVS